MLHYLTLASHTEHGGITDTNLLYKASLKKKKNQHGWLCLTFLSLPSESAQFHEDIAIFSNYDNPPERNSIIWFLFHRGSDVPSIIPVLL